MRAKEMHVAKAAMFGEDRIIDGMTRRAPKIGYRKLGAAKHCISPSNPGRLRVGRIGEYFVKNVALGPLGPAGQAAADSSPWRFLPSDSFSCSPCAT